MAFAAPDDDYQISGTMVDHLSNRPLSHVLVEIIRNGKGGGDASVLTEADGRFIFLHVPKGKYNLQAQRRGQFPQGFHASEGGFATAIVVDGVLKTDNIVFPLPADSSLRGLIVGDDGEPIRNAQVQLLHESVMDGEAQIGQGQTNSTNSSGQFHFGHLEAGRYYVAASGTPWFNTGLGSESVYPVTFYGDTTDGRAAQPVTIAEGATADVQILLHLVPAIHVRLTNNHENYTLGVAGPGGTFIPVSSTITMARIGGQLVGQFGGLQSGAAKTSADSTEHQASELSNIPAGKYEVMSFQQNTLTQTVQNVDLANGSTLSLESLSSQSVVSGRVVFDAPRPEGELNIFLGGKRGGSMAAVGPDGTFKFEKTAGGTYEVNLNSPSLMATSIEAKGARISHDRLEVSSGSAVDLTIHAQAMETMSKVEGFAIHEGAGIAGAMVLLLPQDLSRTRLIRRDQSDLDGSFLLPNVLPGRYTVVAINDGHDLAYKDAKLIEPYLADGVAITVPQKGNDPMMVPVQTRKE